MLRLIQIIRYLAHEGFNRKMIEEMIDRIINGEGELFELTDKQIEKIASISKDEKKFEGAFLIGMEHKYKRKA